MEANKQSLTGVKKRQQIQAANRIVFIWVAIAAAIVSIALVLTQFMVKQFLYNNKVYGKQIETNTILLNSAKAYDPLKDEVTKLVTNAELTRLRVDATDNPLQVIIDAMPTSDDRIGLAASLQQVILAKSGATIESIGLASDQTSSGSQALPADLPAGVSPIPFSFVATGTYDTMRAMFDSIHSSIRPIDIVSVKL